VRVVFITLYCSYISKFGVLAINVLYVVLEMTIFFYFLFYCSDSKVSSDLVEVSQNVFVLSATLAVLAVLPSYRIDNVSFLCLHLSLFDLYFSVWTSAKCWFVLTWLPANVTVPWRITGLLEVPASHSMCDYSAVNVWYALGTVLSYLIYEIYWLMCEICCWWKVSARMHCKCMDDVNCAFVHFVVWTRVIK
jgi:hypothetical protein